MFIFGSGLYLIATMFAWLLPEEQANSNKRKNVKKRSSLVNNYGAANDDLQA